MDIEKFSIIYEEINEKNKKFVKDLEKNKNFDIGVLCFYEEDTDEPKFGNLVRRCKSRNICRIYRCETFTEDEWLENICNLTIGFLPSDTIIWYCTDNVELAIQCKFSNPYYCSHDPFGKQVSCKYALTKINDPNFQTNSRQRHTGVNENYMDFQNKRISPTIENTTLFKFCRKQEDIENVKLKIRFDQEDLSYLRSLVYGGRTVNDDGTTSQKEVSGTMYLEYTGKNFDLKIDRTKNFNAHDEEKVRFVNGLINFHTHPTDVYNAYEVDMMYPSPSDYISILTFFVQKHKFEDFTSMISPLLFSFVVTVEGVYIISLNENYSSQDDKEYLRSVICDKKEGFYDLKQSVKESINSKLNGLSGFLYGKSGSKKFYDTHCKYIGDPKDHPLGYRQIGGFDYDTTKHNRTEEQLSHFPEVLEKDGFEFSRTEQAAKDYCLKINRRELVTGTKFRKGPVINVEFMTYEEAESNHFNIPVRKIGSDKIPKQLFLCHETLESLDIMFNHKYQ